ncbi:unnamed protein product [Ilex paraguariensis]|uniref:Uncharacterized protein n=1 Tax=Ilex paraguariensis TaxID=185542 RepID=A0ABC8RXR7_9AQUA
MAGQSLWFYSSWFVFTLKHHKLVWYAAWRVRLVAKFFDYALLGDGFVIVDLRINDQFIYSDM